MSNECFSNLVEFIRSIYCTNENIPLHKPTMGELEKDHICNTIDSTFVSSMGETVRHFETTISEYAGAASAVSVMNGSAALHACLYYIGLGVNDIVITQALTFVATCNAIHQLGAEPVFVDISRDTLGMCELSLEDFLESECYLDSADHCIHKESGKTVKAVLPMHTFGHPVRIDRINEIADRFHLVVIEDAAESLGSFFKKQHTGTFGKFGVISFNGNKIITTGGGGMVLCRDAEDAGQLLHLTTTAKIPHKYEFYHDAPGFNYRLPNLNASLGVAQFSRLQEFLEQKRILASCYSEYFSNSELTFVYEPKNSRSNYWLNAIHCPDSDTRKQLLEYTNNNGVMTRPVWTLMHRLPAFENSYRTDLSNSIWAESTLVNLPSTPVQIP